MRGWTAGLATLSLAASFAVGCGDRGASDLLVSALSERLAKPAPDGVSQPLWNDVHRFYESNGSHVAWVDRRNPQSAARAIAILRTANRHGLPPQSYNAIALDNELREVALLERKAPDRDARLADLDARLTAALLTFGNDVALGTTSPGRLDRRWKARREPPDVAAALAASTKDLTTFLARVEPRHPQYAALVGAMDNLLLQQAQGGWPHVEASSKKNAAAVNQTLVKRLAAEGYLRSNTPSTSESFDEEITGAVIAFQEHHRLKASGTLDAATIESMNVPIERRIEQVAMNLERWRWMPDDFGDRHLLVNIPAFTVYVREHGTTVQDIRVVTGKADGHETPVFSGTMSNVVFSPYWNVPDSIAQGETAPAAATDPGYLSRNHIEVLRNGRVIDEADVDWSDPDAVRQVSFRQEPGAKNALGRVKFLFPNPYDIYLHDTPADSLFARPMRALSHGCVRVEEPEALAKYVLRGEPSWTDEKIAAAMLSGVEQHVKLDAPLPVHIVYFTTWVDEQGGLHFLSDPYHFDTKQAQSGVDVKRGRASAGKNARSTN
jgi:murein L,D-transpeptidase YcbB/YkuD